MWRCVKQINDFYRVEEPRTGMDRDGKPFKPNVICIVSSEAMAKLICTAVNNSGLKVEMFLSDKEKEKQKAKQAPATKVASGVG